MKKNMNNLHIFISQDPFYIKLSSVLLIIYLALLCSSCNLPGKPEPGPSPEAGGVQPSPAEPTTAYNYSDDIEFRVSGGEYQKGKVFNMAEGYATLSNPSIKTGGRPRLEAPAGFADLIRISPDMRTIFFQYTSRENQAPGPVAVTAVFPIITEVEGEEKQTEIAGRQFFCVYGDGGLSIGDKPADRADDGHPGFTPPSSHVVFEDSKVKILIEGRTYQDESLHGFAEYRLGDVHLSFRAILKPEAGGAPGTAEVTADRGSIEKPRPGPMVPNPDEKMAPGPYQRDREVFFSYLPEQKNEIVQEGPIRISVSFPVENQGQTVDCQGTVKLEVRKDGGIIIPIMGKK